MHLILARQTMYKIYSLIIPVSSCFDIQRPSASQQIMCECHIYIYIGAMKFKIFGTNASLKNARSDGGILPGGLDFHGSAGT